MNRNELELIQNEQGQEFRKIRIILINDSSDANHSSNLQSQLLLHLQKKKKTNKKKIDKYSKQSKHTSLTSYEDFSVRMRNIIILNFVYMLRYGESESTTTSYKLLSMNMMSTLNFEYEYNDNKYECV